MEILTSLDTPKTNPIKPNYSESFDPQGSVWLIVFRERCSQFIAIFVAALAYMAVGEDDVGYAGVSVVAAGFVVCGDVVIEEVCVVFIYRPHVKIVIIQVSPGQAGITNWRNIR